MSTLITNHNNGNLADVEFDFAQVTSALPNRKITPRNDAANLITFGDTSETDANGKIGRHFLNLCRHIFRQIDICARSDPARGRRMHL